MCGLADLFDIGNGFKQTVPSGRGIWEAKLCRNGTRFRRWDESGV